MRERWVAAAFVLVACIPDVVPTESAIASDVPLQCRDLTVTGDESDIDCGGIVCKPCFSGKKCLRVEDCDGSTCNADGVCEPELLGVWEKITPLSFTNPKARSGHSLVYFVDSATASQEAATLLFGGPANDPDTWGWDGQFWTQRPSNQAPQPRDHAVMVYLGSDDVILYGGDSSSVYFDTWRYNGSAWKQLPPPVFPKPRVAASAVFDPVDGRLRMLGGYDHKQGSGSKMLIEGEWFWSSDTDEWEEGFTQAPPARWAASMVFARFINVLFGGTVDDESGNDELWMTTPAWTLTTTAIAPPPRFAAAMAFESRRDRVVLFGGTHAGALLGDTWELQADGPVWQPVNTPVAPTPRRDSAIVFDQKRKRVVLFGGRDAINDLDDTWEYHVRGNTCVTDEDCDTSSCVDGICCEATSCDPCQACNVTGSVGVCAPVPVGRTDPGSCGGICDGAGVCSS